MLKIAVPNKGTLAEAAVEMLREAGYLAGRAPVRELVVADPVNDAEFFFLRPRDIAVYVADGTLDCGITGRDLLLDSGAVAEELVALGFGGSAFRLAAPPEIAALGLAGLNGLRLATAYPGLISRCLAEVGVTARVVPLDGAVENAVRLGVADAIADVVDTGRTLKQAGLEVIGEPLLQSEAILIGRATGDQAPLGIAKLLRRLQGVIVARSYVMMDYDVRVELIDRVTELTPGIESPTMSPLQREGWVAVRAMVPRADSHQVMDDLFELGARGILVTSISACRL